MLKQSVFFGATRLSDDKPSSSAVVLIKHNDGSFHQEIKSHHVGVGRETCVYRARAELGYVVRSMDNNDNCLEIEFRQYVVKLWNCLRSGSTERRVSPTHVRFVNDGIVAQ